MRTGHSHSLVALVVVASVAGCNGSYPNGVNAAGQKVGAAGSAAPGSTAGGTANPTTLGGGSTGAGSTGTGSSTSTGTSTSTGQTGTGTGSTRTGSTGTGSTGTGSTGTGTGTGSTGTGTGSTGVAKPRPTGGSGGITGVTPGTPAMGLLLDPAYPTSKYSIYVPANYNASTPIGVVLAFHGVEGTSTPDGWFQVLVGFCNQDRFIVVAPYGDVNDGGSGAWTQPWGRSVLDVVRFRYNVDDSKLYCAAISGGCLPALWMTMGNAPGSYQSTYGNYTIQACFQNDFAAVGFCAPAYGPSDPDFAGIQSQTASLMGFAPALWVDYGSQSSNKPQADDIASWGTAHGYAPVNEVVRPNEGHAPSSPYGYEKQMFDLFAATTKP